jgi:phospholipid-binding lipoprotein MlaA
MHVMQGLSQRLKVVIAAFLLVGTLGACASNDQTAQVGMEEPGWFGPDNDPLEFINRFTFAFNDALDTMLIQPAAATYRVILPRPVRNGIRNVLRNLNGPVILANDLLQLEWDRAGDTFMRFLINSTIGVAGIFDVAAEWGYTYHDEDFGQTMGAWGAGEGFYLVLPLLGPSNLRDTAGMVVDSYMDPWSYVLDYATKLSDTDITYIMIGRRGLEGIDMRARNIETIESIKADAVDYYARIRTLYRQNRNSEIANGNPQEIPVPGVSESDWQRQAEPTAGLLYPYLEEQSTGLNDLQR